MRQHTFTPTFFEIEIEMRGNDFEENKVVPLIFKQF